MEKFKFRKQNLRGVARNIKEQLKGKDYFECYIMYNVNDERFFTCEPIEKDMLESEGHVLYELFSFTSADGKIPTIDEIIKMVFDI